MRYVLVLALCFVPLFAARAADPPAKSLLLSPAPESIPALRYQLLPEVIDQTPGNAAQVYYRAMLPETFHHRRMEKIDDKVAAWQKASLAELPRQEMEWLLKYVPLAECDLAARREQCDWELSTRMRAAGVGTLLPDVQGMRELARLNVLRARLQLAAGDQAGAIRSLETGMSLARQVGDAPVVISALVGVACARICLEEVEEVIQQPGAPNLYWALTVLPRPFIDFRHAMQGERLMVEATFPWIREAESHIFSEQEAQSAVRKVQEMYGMIQGGQVGTGEVMQLALMIGSWDAAARKALLAAGRRPEDVKAMPTVQAVALFARQSYQARYDDFLKFAGLPYWEAAPRLAALEKSQREREKSGTALPLDALVPALSKAYAAGSRLDRQIAALRNVEALRLYAAAHQGKLPARLNDVEVPVALDPMTGEAFDYRVEGEKAVLTAKPAAGEEGSANNFLRYEISIRKP